MPLRFLTKEMAFKEAVPLRARYRGLGLLYDFERPPKHRPRGAKSEGKGGGVRGKPFPRSGRGRGQAGAQPRLGWGQAGPGRAGAAGQARGPAALCWLLPREVYGPRRPPQHLTGSGGP